MRDSIIIRLVRTPSRDEFSQLADFHTAFKELEANWHDLCSQGFNLSAGSELQRDGKVHTDRTGVSRFRLKGFLVDYRVLSLQKEHIHTPKIQNLVRNLTRSSEVSAVLDRHKRSWINISHLAGWHNDFSGDDILEAFFNEQLFHKRQTKTSRLMLDDVRSKMSDDSIWWEVILGAFTRLGLISELDWMLQPLLGGNNHIRIRVE